MEKMIRMMTEQFFSFSIICEGAWYFSHPTLDEPTGLASSSTCGPNPTKNVRKMNAVITLGQAKRLIIKWVIQKKLVDIHTLTSKIFLAE